MARDPREMMRKLPEDYYADFHLVAAVQALCENSLFRTEKGQAFERAIMRIVKPKLQQLLAAYDRAKDYDG